MAVVLLGAQGVLGATYYVSTDGLDSNPGSQSLPWRTVQKAADSVSPGDTVRVAAGIYNETVKTPKGGTSSARIVFDGGGTTTVKCFFVDKPHLTITGFKLTGDPEFRTSPITLEHGAHHSIISHNIIDTAQERGMDGIQIIAEVFSEPGDTNAARNCEIVSNHIGNVLGATAILVGGRNNIIRQNTVSNIYSADFVRLFGHNNLIQHNQFLNNVPREGVGYHADFIQTFGELQMASLGHVIDGNIISNVVDGQLCQLTMVNSFDAGMHGGWVFKNNIFADIALQASIGIPDVKWLNNLFLRCNQKGHALAFGYTEDRSNPEGAVVLNNMFIDCGPPGLDNLGWYPHGAVTNFTADYNMVAKDGFKPVREENPPSAYRWYEPHGINGGDPQFIDFARFDLRLRPSSPLVNSGTSLAEVQTDMAGTARPQNGAWDIGPFETVTGAVPRTPLGLRIIVAQ